VCVIPLNPDPNLDLILDIEKNYAEQYDFESTTRQTVFRINHRACVELLDADMVKLQHAVILHNGLLVNKHSVDRIRYVKMEGSPPMQLKLTEDDRIDYPDGDAVLLDIQLPGVDRTQWITPSQFADIPDGKTTKVCLVTRSRGWIEIHPGLATGTKDHLSFGNVGVYDSNTKRGDCGGIVFDETGHVLGIHFFGGTGGTNLFMPTGKDFSRWLQTVRKNRPSPRLLGEGCA
jgi:hypothetical protein